MSTRYWLGIAFAVLLLLSSFLSVSANPSGERTLQTVPPPPPFDVIRVDVASDGTPGNGVSRSPSISGDGRFVAFTSESTNLVPGDTNDATDIFMHDAQTGVTKRVSVSSDGQQADANNYAPSISGDGRYVVFSSRATNLVSGDSNGAEDIFLYDNQTGIINRVSVTSDGAEANGNSKNDVSISADGRYITFVSYASNLDLISADTNAMNDVFVHDRLTGQSTRITASIYREQVTDDPCESWAYDGCSYVFNPRINSDGSFIIFEILRIVCWECLGHKGDRDLYLYEMQNGTTTKIDVTSGSNVTGGNSSFSPSVSANGQQVAFQSHASDPGGTHGVLGIFVYDFQNGITNRVSVSSDMTPADRDSQSPSISADSRYVAFSSSARNLVATDTNGRQDVFVYDLFLGLTSRVSITSDGAQFSDSSYDPTISADGKYLAYVRDGQIYVIDFEKARQDIYPPLSSVDALPEFSRSLSIPLAWYAADSLSPLGTVGTIDHFDVQVRVGESGVWQDVITATQVTSYTYSAQTDGLHQFRVRAVDDAGNVEGWPESYDTHTVVDQTSPTGAIAINYNPNSGIAAEFTTSRNVSLWLSANDDTSGVTDFRLSTDGITYGLWQPIAEQTTTVLDGLSGLQLVAAQFRDRVGNQSTTYTDTIILASQLGTDYGLSINNGDLFTNQAAVTLTIAAAPYTAEMQVSNDGGFQNSPWQPYSLSKPWQITAFGSFQMPRIVYARFRNTDGSTSAIYQDDIILDPNAPKSNVTELVLGRLGRNSFPLTVRWVGEDDISGVKWYDIQVQLDSGEWQNWLTSTTAQESSYSVMPGHRYAFRTRAQDYAGNWESYRNTEMSIAIPITTELRQYLPSIHR